MSWNPFCQSQTRASRIGFSVPIQSQSTAYSHLIQAIKPPTTYSHFTVKFYQEKQILRKANSTTYVKKKKKDSKLKTSKSSKFSNNNNSQNFHPNWNTFFIQKNMGNHISTSTAEEIPIPILNSSSKTHELRNTLRQNFGRL